MKKNIIIVRGGGDIATGTIYKLHQSGYPVLVTEIANPSAIRRQVAFSEAVYEKSYTVEGVTCYFAENLTRAYELLKQRKVALMIDPDGAVIREVKPAAVVDGILAKKNLGTTMDMAPFTVALGPGFTAGVDVHAVVETMRGHKLGRIIYEGNAIPNTGIPGAIAGVAKERVIHAECAGFIWRKKDFRLRAKRRSDRLHLSGYAGEGCFRAGEKRRCICSESHHFRDSPWTHPGRLSGDKRI